MGLNLRSSRIEVRSRYDDMQDAACQKYRGQWTSAAAAGKPSASKLGRFLVHAQFQGSVHSSALFLTAAAQNLLCLKLAGAPMHARFCCACSYLPCMLALKALREKACLGSEILI